VTANQELPLHQALLDPGAYPDAPTTVEFIQTHISYVFLAGSSVYKLKKPVDFGFLDFSTIERRHAACLDELRLNRRLSPDVYLEVLPVTRSGNRMSIDGSGEIVDWAVHMRRLPGDRMLERLVADHAVPAGAGSQLAEIIGRFHLQADGGDRITAVGGRAAIEGNWRESFDQVQPFRGRTIEADDDDQIQAYVGRFLNQEQPLLAARDAGGFIRDLHGDLRSAQIWLLEAPPPQPASLAQEERRFVEGLGGVRILDCIEFNERLRFCDTASDIAFLAMDLAFRGAPGLARELMGRYLEVTADERLPLLLNFYACYRAYVRGKVDSLAVREREIDRLQRARLIRRARRFFRLALRYASKTPRPRLTIMVGISGSGKSYLARLLAIETGAALFSSDVTRKRLLGLPLTATAPQAAYSHDQSAKTFAAMLDSAEDELRQGHPVILDATFLTASQRLPPRRLAERRGVPLTAVWCQVDQAVLDQRLRAREADRYRVSDAAGRVAAEQRRYQEPPRELPGGSVMRIDTSRPLGPVLRRIRQRMS